jgi:hypothetical protein
MKMEQTECSETSAYKIQTPGNYPEEIIEHLEHGESLKSEIIHVWQGNKALRMENNRDIFSKASIRMLGPTQPAIQRVPENLSPGIMRSGPETDHLNELNVET